MKEERKIFLIEGDATKQITAAGVLFYATHENKVMLLMRYTKMARGKFLRLSDLGGKAQQSDESPIDTAIREAWEESNGHFTVESLLK